jgi:hypothetical protein
MKRMLSVLLGATVLLAPLLLNPSMAVAQTQQQVKPQSNKELLARLNDLTRSKGYKAFAIGAPVCQGLNLRSIGNCEVFQVPYSDSEKYNHAVNTFDEPGTGIVRIILSRTNVSNPIQTREVYLIGLDGVLKRAMIKRGSKELGGTWVSMPAADAAAGFERELRYWRDKQEELAGEADRCTERWKSENPTGKC